MTRKTVREGIKVMGMTKRRILGDERIEKEETEQQKAGKKSNTILVRNRQG